MTVQACATEQVNTMCNRRLIQFSWGLSQETWGRDLRNVHLTSQKDRYIYPQALNPPYPVGQKLPHVLVSEWLRRLFWQPHEVHEPRSGSRR